MAWTKTQKHVAVAGGILTAIGVAAGTIYHFLKPPPAPVCREGATTCVRTTLYKCIDGKSVLYESNSPSCGYVAPLPEEEGVPPEEEEVISVGSRVQTTIDMWNIGSTIVIPTGEVGTVIEKAPTGYEPDTFRVKMDNTIYGESIYHNYQLIPSEEEIPEEEISAVTVKGRIINTERYPVEGTIIQFIGRITDDVVKTVSDNDGYFSVSLPSNVPFDLQVNHPDYTYIRQPNINEMIGYPDGFTTLGYTWGEEPGTYNMGIWYTTLSEIREINTLETNLSNPQTDDLLAGDARVRGYILGAFYDPDTGKNHSIYGFDISLNIGGVSVWSKSYMPMYGITNYPFSYMLPTNTVSNGDYALKMKIYTTYWPSQYSQLKKEYDWVSIPVKIFNG